VTPTDLPPKPPATIRVVVDAMGGDFSPRNEIAGTRLALAELRGKAQVVLVGREQALVEGGFRHGDKDLLGVFAEDVVGMADEPSTIVKQRKNSSLYVGLDLVREGRADAFVSAGNTGAVMATATILCGRIAGVSRPTIGSFFPTETGNPTLVLDVGANVDSKPQFLHDYAVMGSVYCELMRGIAHPKVGLLNVGEEEEKGTEVIRETHELLKHAPINFVGNVEGRDILRGKADVVVCDGFEGNIVLKFAESVLGFLRARFRAYAEKGLLQRVAIAALRPVLRGALADMDYQAYGGVPLLGVNGVVIIGHGSSTPTAIKNMVVRAVEMVERNVNGSIRQALASVEEKGTPTA
jgi:glycerol-3-phosphate acyltransferase PlsX